MDESTETKRSAFLGPSDNVIEMAQGSAALRRAAKHVEDTAYDLAATVECELISEMIIIAADLERLAKEVDRRLKT